MSESIRRLSPKLRWPTSRFDKAIAETPLADLLGKIELLIEDHSDAAVALARRQGLVVGLSKRSHEHGKKRRSIRAVCRASAPAMIKAEMATNIGNALERAISVLRAFKEVEILINPGERHVPAEFVIIAELRDFHAFRQVLLLFERRWSLSRSRKRHSVRCSKWTTNRGTNPTTVRSFHELHRRRVHGPTH